MAMSSSPENAQDEAPEEEPDVTFQQQQEDQDDDDNDADKNDEKRNDRNENNEKHEHVDQHHEKAGKGEEDAKEEAADDEEEVNDDDGDERSEEEDDDDKKSEDGEGNDAKQAKSGERAVALKTDPAASPGPAALTSPGQPPGYPYYYGGAPGSYAHQKSISYSDVSGMVDPIPDPRRNRGGVSEPFPEKLHRMLDTVEREGLSEVVGFFSHGRAFAIHKQKRFINDIMPRFFRQSKLTSFQRQLNLYGFRRLSQGPDNGGYYHELFLKGRPGLCVNMKRVKVKGDLKARRDPDSEPK
jgi:hypothetical protein